MLAAQLAMKKIEEDETQQVLKEKEAEEMQTNIKKAIDENKAKVLQIAVEVAQKRQAEEKQADDEEDVTLKLMQKRAAEKDKAGEDRDTKTLGRDR